MVLTTFLLFSSLISLTLYLLSSPFFSSVLTPLHSSLPPCSHRSDLQIGLRTGLLFPLHHPPHTRLLWGPDPYAIPNTHSPGTSHVTPGSSSPGPAPAPTRAPHGSLPCPPARTPIPPLYTGRPGPGPDLRSPSSPGPPRPPSQPPTAELCSPRQGRETGRGGGWWWAEKPGESIEVKSWIPYTVLRKWFLIKCLLFLRK